MYLKYRDNFTSLTYIRCQYLNGEYVINVKYVRRISVVFLFIFVVKNNFNQIEGNVRTLYFF